MTEKRSTLTQANLYNEYVNNKKSASKIAEEYETNAKQVTRMLKKYGIPVRTRKEAMEIYSEQFGHPRSGVTLSDETKLRISESQSGTWNNERKSKQGKKISDKWKAGEYTSAVLDKAHEGLRDAAKYGSKVEKVAVATLTKAGINCITQADIIYQNLGMKCDIYCPGIDMVIEIDGYAFHMEPIFGEHELQRRTLADQEKNAHLLSKGLKVLRFRVWIKHMSQKHERQLAEEIMKAVEMTRKFGGVQMWDYGKDEE